MLIERHNQPRKTNVCEADLYPLVPLGYRAAPKRASTRRASLTKYLHAIPAHSQRGPGTPHLDTQEKEEQELGRAWHGLQRHKKAHLKVFIWIHLHTGHGLLSRSRPGSSMALRRTGVAP